MKTTPPYMKLLEPNHARESDLIKDMLDFAVKIDIPYRLKRIDGFITLYGYEFTRNLENIFLESILDINKEPRHKRFDYSIDINNYKKLISTPSQDLYSHLDSIIHSESTSFLKQYNSNIDNTRTKNKLKIFLKNESQRRDNSLIKSSERELLNSNHIEKYL